MLPADEQLGRCLVTAAGWAARSAHSMHIQKDSCQQHTRPQLLYAQVIDSAHMLLQAPESPSCLFPCTILQGDARMYTACGDTTIGIWDTGSAQALACCAGHSRAVKCLSLLDADSGDIFASGMSHHRPELVTWN